MSAQEPEHVLRCQFPEKLGRLFEPSRYKVVYGGRGKGASWGIARALLIKGYQSSLRVLCTREIQKTISESVHQLLKDQVANLGLESFYTVREKEIIAPNGTLFSFAGLRDLSVTNLKSYEGYDIAWVEEAEKTSKKSWTVLIPTIRKPASEIWVNFNPQLDSDETYVRFIENTPPDTILMPMSYRDNPWFPDVLEKERQHLERTDPAEYENVWEGKCRATVAGAIYAAEIREAIEQKRVRPLPYDPMLKVHVVWDLGWNDSMSLIFVQRQASGLFVIDFLEDRLRTYDWYAAEIKAKRYNLGKMWLPHDGAHKNPQTGLSAADILRKLGLNVAQVLPRHDPEQGIKAVRMAFQRMYFDETKAKPLLDHLKRYRRHIPTSTGEPQEPVHDEHSHAADALRYMVMAAASMTNDQADAPLPLPRTGIV